MTNMELINIHFVLHKNKILFLVSRQHEVLLAIEMFINDDGRYISSTSQTQLDYFLEFRLLVAHSHREARQGLGSKHHSCSNNNGVMTPKFFFFMFLFYLIYYFLSCHYKYMPLFACLTLLRTLLPISGLFPLDLFILQVNYQKDKPVSYCGNQFASFNEKKKRKKPASNTELQ